MKKINHIGIAVKNIDETLPFYTETLGLTFRGVDEVESEGVKVAFLSIGESNFELLEPLHEESPIAKFIEKRGEGIHHIALEVDDIHARLEQFKSEGIRMIHDQPKQGAHDTQVAFLHPKAANGVLLELCQPKQED
uniref:methylmalonyl-CoA epimerase n=1 Tax=uncultured Allobacillus sp. TaxID=1638025 RepID=UPI00338DE6F5